MRKNRLLHAADLQLHLLQLLEASAAVLGGAPCYHILLVHVHPQHRGAFGGMEYDDLLTGSRTVLPLWWEKLFFCPHHINYHIEHHLYPSVPCHNLPALHDVLMRDGVFKGKAHVTRGYLTGVVTECQLDPSKGSSPGRVV